MIKNEIILKTETTKEFLIDNKDKIFEEFKLRSKNNAEINYVQITKNNKLYNKRNWSFGTEINNYIQQVQVGEYIWFMTDNPSEIDMLAIKIVKD